MEPTNLDLKKSCAEKNCVHFVKALLQHGSYATVSNGNSH